MLPSQSSFGHGDGTPSRRRCDLHTRGRVVVVALVILATLSGTAGAVWSQEPEDDGASERDPLEPLNRFTFEFNRRVLRYTVRPIAVGYRFIVPRPVRNGFRNAFDNLDNPLTFGNQVLQGRADAAVQTLARLVVNTTIGLGGTIDVASRLGIPRGKADLGLTLAARGVGAGPYLVVPLLGPATPRDALASFAQGTIDPFNFWVSNTDYAFYAFLGRFVLGSIDRYARHMDELDAIEKSSVDFYAAIRNLYSQKRAAELRAVVGEDIAAPAGVDYDVDFDESESLDAPVPEASSP